MEPGRPSLTALGAARLRAAHQVLDRASILTDPLAARILGTDIEVALEHADAHVSGPRMRWFIAARSRIAEDALTEAVRHGARQLVVLGAGLDTLAFRTPLAGRLRIFEVDHPATQAWKREKLAAAAIGVPETLRFVPVDFERQTLAEALQAAGFVAEERSFFSWLGVVPYLSEQAIFSTLAFMARLPGGAEVVFDYVNPPASIAPAGRAAHQALAERVASLGESLQSYFDTERLCAELGAIGFRRVADIDPARLAARFFPEAERSAPTRGGHIMHAATA
jgi:methyltransferase (TIGR00027 family)